jgi:hypothetical protein
MTDSDISNLVFVLTGERSDLDFLRSRVEAAIEEAIEEEQARLDSPVETDWTWADQPLVDKLLGA